jgi:hypothetical protein
VPVAHPQTTPSKTRNVHPPAAPPHFLGYFLHSTRRTACGLLLMFHARGFGFRIPAHGSGCEVVDQGAGELRSSFFSSVLLEGLLIFHFLCHPQRIRIVRRIHAVRA